MEVDTLRDLLVKELSDIYSAEKQLLKALPKMAKAATFPELRQAFETHTKQTEGHVARLDDVFSALGEKPKRVKCKGMEGLIEEGSELLKEKGEPAALDAGMIAAAQRVEHYEIAAYGTVRAMAEQLGQTELVRLFERTLKEEKLTDEKLTKVSVGEVLVDASQLDEQEEGEDESSPKARAGAGGNGTGGRAGASKQRR
jgi:ferritin-like metal-binding protein YciE